MTAHVVVIGAGISGLAAAVELDSRGIDVTILEKSSRAGGPIRTERCDGYIIDAGPDSFLSTKPGGVAFAERLGIAGDIIDTSPDGGGTYIVHSGRMEPLPEGITMLVPTQFRQILGSPLLSLTGKARLLAEYFIPARSDEADESVAAFMQRRVGRQAFENLAEPLLSGIFAGDANKLSILSTFPRLRDAERRHGSLIKAAIAARRRSANSPSQARRHTPFVSFAKGLDTIVTAAIDHIRSERLRLDTEAVELIAMQPGYRVRLSNGDEIDCDGVVVATPAIPTSKLLADLLPGASAALDTIPYVSSATVSMAFRESDVDVSAGGRGFVIPRVEGFDLTAVTWSSRKFAGRVPEGRMLLRGFVGRAGNEEPAFLPDDQVVEIVRRDLAKITGITAEPEFARVFRWHRGMPQYHVGHAELVATIEREVAAAPSLEVVGAAYHGVGIPDCISTATATAARLAGELTA